MSEQFTPSDSPQQPTNEKTGKPHSHNWKGGSVASNGYKLVFVGKGHHLADVRGYAYEHRLVAEEKLGRRLGEGEMVHHKDENKLNNDPDNLEVVKGNAEHLVLHRGESSNRRRPGEPNELVTCACVAVRRSGGLTRTGVHVPMCRGTIRRTRRQRTPYSARCFLG
jgi:hypothetical protein